MTGEAGAWAARLAPYKAQDNRRALGEIALTLLPFLGLWSAAAALAQSHAALAVVLAVCAAGFLMRLFMIQHDCGHGAMFTSRFWNDWTGRAIGVLTLTPYDYWRSTHARHHAGSGNLDRRGVGDIDTLTVKEYLARSRSGRLAYRLYRHPLVMFGLGPLFLFCIRHRNPPDAARQSGAAVRSVHLTNVAIVLAAAVVIHFIGLKVFLLVHLPAVALAASAGVWLFYVQHQFDGTQWDHDADWSHDKAALGGSSYYDLPRPLMWLTGNIGIHHLHHLSSRIPFHRLPRVLADYPELRATGRLSLRQSLGCVKLALWDEEARELISFRALSKRHRAGVLV